MFFEQDKFWSFLSKGGVIAVSSKLWKLSKINLFHVDVLGVFYFP